MTSLVPVGSESDLETYDVEEQLDGEEGKAVDDALRALATDLNGFVRVLLGRRYRGTVRDLISRRELVSLINELYAASLDTDEGSSPRVRLALVPRVPRSAELRAVTPLRDALEITAERIIRIAGASEPRTSIYAFEMKENRPQLWGIIDRQNDRRRYDEFEGSGTTFPRRVLELSIDGVGRLSAYDQAGFICAVRPGAVEIDRHDAFEDAEFFDCFSGSIQHYATRALRARSEVYIEDAVECARDVLYTVLRRISLRVRALGHGGALLISPAWPSEIPEAVGTDYQHLCEAIERTIRENLAPQMVRRDKGRLKTRFRDRLAPYRPRSAITQKTADHLDNSIWCVALFSRVDGAVALTPSLCVRGFGVIVALSGSAPQVWEARRSREVVTWVPSRHEYGTRHRAAMHFCSTNPRSVALLATEEGDLRAVTQHVSEAASVAPALRNAMTSPTAVRLWKYLPVLQSDLGTLTGRATVNAGALYKQLEMEFGGSRRRGTLEPASSVAAAGDYLE